MGRDGKGKVGFISIGTMGREMVRNLLKAGHAVAVFDLSEAAVADAVGEGALRAQDPAGTAEGNPRRGLPRRSLGAPERRA